MFPRSELDTANFSEVDIDDSVIFSTLIGTRLPEDATLPTTNVVPEGDITLSDIVSDVAAGGTQYTNKIVTIQGTIKSVFESGARTLITNNQNVSFYIINQTNPELLDSYKKGNTYTLTVFIDEIEPPEEQFNWYAIWSTLPKDANVISVNFPSLVESLSSGNTEYLNRLVRFTATVKNPASIFTTTDTITVATNKDKVSFFVRNRTFPPKIMNKYQRGQSYKMTVFVEKVAVSEILGTSIHSVIVFE